MFFHSHTWAGRLAQVASLSPEEQKELFQIIAREIKQAQENLHDDLAELEYALVEIEHQIDLELPMFEAWCKEVGLDPCLERA